MPTKTITIFVDANADVSDVLHELSDSRSDTVILAFPTQALIMQNLINLQIIHSYLPILGKDIKIATSDLLAQKIVGMSGIPLHLPGESEEDVVGHGEELGEPAEARAKSIAVEDQRHATPWVNFRKKSLKSPASQLDEFQKSPPLANRFALPAFPQFQVLKLSLPKYSTAQVRLVASLSAIGLVLLGTTAFFVLPKAYVAIEVQSEPYAKQFTLTLADEQDSQAVGPNILPGRFVETSREQVVTFQATGEVNKGSTAAGQLNAVNYTNGIQGILANTKFVTDSGLVFKIKNDVLVPPARGNVPGRAVVEAVSEGGGAKYNVSSPTKLTIPNL